MLDNKDNVLKSKQLPFRFFSAYHELQKVDITTNKVFDVLENAIEYSIDNLEKIKGITVIAIDVSGSMNGAPISSKSSVKCNDIASIIGAMANKLCEESIIYTFDTSIKKFTISPRAGILETAKSLNFSGGGTDISLPLKAMLEYRIKADRLIILSDNEINCGYSGTCQQLADLYRGEYNPNLWVHAIDLQGYGTQQFMGSKTNIIAGWNEKVLEFINLAEQGIDTQVKRIENYGN